MDTNNRIIVGITGASGVIYAREFVKEMLRQEMQVHLIISPSTYTVWAAELGVGGKPDKVDFHKWLGLDEISDKNLVHWKHDDIAAGCASGTFRFRGMIILPCSMNTLGAMANGIADNLITRAADVCLKEKRPLVVVPRETPLNLIHLKNMTTLYEAGARIVPAMPGFYHKPETIDDLVELFVMKLCDQFDLPCSFFHRWREKQQEIS